ncbi:hypothetical protein LIER_16337 [Lithospermum erythrorhizon]|uniref:Reverse transcriptase RNase H-like domain-containing protein n=1 Tax=Lithospermum erythrorhizon TaxID=34254 RepID=A0AAV3Q6B0_LITER
MEPPTSYKDVQKLTVRLAVLSRFISKSGDQNLPFFKKLRQVSEGVVRSVLLREERGAQRPIYYFSHVLHGPEKNYLLIDKFVLALVTLARKLKANFEAHPIRVMTDQPIKRVVSSPVHYGRLTTWAIELSEFEINYAPHTGIKAQVLANFIVENSTRSVSEAPSQEKELEEASKWYEKAAPIGRAQF